MTKYLPSIGFVCLVSLASLIIAGLVWIAEPFWHEYIKLANNEFKQGNYLEAAHLYNKARELSDTNSKQSACFKLAANSYLAAKMYHTAFDYLINATILESENVQTKQALQNFFIEVKQFEPLALSQFIGKLTNYQELDRKTKAEIARMLEKIIAS